MSDEASPDRPDREKKRGQKKTDYAYTSFDLDMIVCAKHQYVVDLYFIAPLRLPLETSGDEVESISATVLIVDKYFLKVSTPDAESNQREIWIAKSVIAAAETHKPGRN